MEVGDGVFEGGPERPSVEYKSTHAGHSPCIAISFFVYLFGDIVLSKQRVKTL